MSKARDLADFISTGSILSDGTIESTEISGVTADATEINKLDGLTADTTELNTLDGVTATTAELNKLAGTTATTSDFDKLSNVTASATELNYMTGATSSIQSQLDNISVTSGSLTKSFTSGESATITLAQSITPAPVVSVTKEVAQTGQSSKGAWDVNATASNYDLHNTAYATTLTPSQVANTNISDATYANKSFSTTTQANTPKAAVFKPDGSKMYVVGFDNSGYIYEYNLSTSWDVSTASYTNNYFFTGGGDTQPFGFYIKSDGLTAYYVGGQADNIRRLSLSTAWDISTASYDGSGFNVTTQETSPRGLWFKPDGTKMYMVGSNAYRVYEYTLSTAWDETTASVAGSYGVGVQDNSPRGVTFNSTGTKMYVAGGTNSDIFQYTLSTAWDVTSASYDNVSLDITPQDAGLSDVFIGDNGTKIYATGDSNGAIYQYTNASDALTLGTGSFASTDVGKRIQGNGGDVILTSTAGAYSTTGGSAFTDSSTIASGSWTMHGLKSAGDADGLTIAGLANQGNPASTTFNYEFDMVNQGGVGSNDHRDLYISRDGNYAFTVDTGNNLRRFSLSTAYDLSTGTYDQLYDLNNMPGFATTCQAITFDDTGQQLYAVDLNGNLSRSTLSTAWSLSNVSAQGYHATGFSSCLGLAVSSDGYKFYIASSTGRIKTFTYNQAYQPGSGYYVSDTNFDVNTAAYAGVGNTRIEGLSLNDDNTKLLVTMYDGTKVLQISMSTAGDLSTASLDGTIDLLPVTDYPTGVSWINDIAQFGVLSRLDESGNAETKIHVYNTGSNFVPTSQYHIGVTNASGQIDSSFWTDINSMTADQSLGDGEAYYAVSTDDRTTWSVAKGSDGVRPIVRDNAGTWQYNNNQGTTVGNSLANGSYSSNFDLSTISTSSNGISEIQWVNNGNHLMVCGNTNDYVTRWNASTPYDINSLSLSQNFNVSSQEIYLTSMHMSPDGYHLYVGGNQGNDVNEYTLTTAFDLFSASFTRNPVSVGNIGAIWFKPDGTKMYTMSFNGVSVQTFNLSTAWDTSTATSQGGFNLPNSSTSGASAMVFSDDGYHLYVSFAVEDVVKHYTLSTAWDVSTVSTNPASLSYASQASNMEGLTFNSDFTEMHTGTGSTLYKYDITQSSYTTSTTWTNATTNDEFYALQQALGATEFNRMNKTQLDAVADGSHFTLGNTLDLMIALKQDTASASLPTSDGVTINYDAAALNQGAVLGTDYDFDFPANNKVRITSNAAQNLKIRVV